MYREIQKKLMEDLSAILILNDRQVMDPRVSLNGFLERGAI